MSYGNERNMLAINKNINSIKSAKTEAYQRGQQHGQKGIYSLANLTLQTMASYDAGYKEGFSKHVKH